MPCLQWTLGGSGGLVLPQVHARRVRSAPGIVIQARAGLRQWGGKMEWNGKGSKGGDSVKAAASMSSG